MKAGVTKPFATPSLTLLLGVQFFWVRRVLREGSRRWDGYLQQRGAFVGAYHLDVETLCDGHSGLSRSDKVSIGDVGLVEQHLQLTFELSRRFETHQEVSNL